MRVCVCVDLKMVRLSIVVIMLRSNLVEFSNKYRERAMKQSNSFIHSDQCVVQYQQYIFIYNNIKKPNKNTSSKLIIEKHHSYCTQSERTNY